MKEYLAQFSNDFIGLTAPPPEVKKLAGQFSTAFFKQRTGTEGEYTMSHSPQVFVVDPAGQLRAELYAASIDAMGRHRCNVAQRTAFTPIKIEITPFN